MPEEHAAEQPLKGASGIEPLFTFPHPVNEYGSRSIAGLSFFTATATATATAIGEAWLTLALVHLFIAGVIAGPKLTPTDWLTTKFIVPRVIKRPVAGPPKQFAQGAGLVFSVAAAALAIGFGMGMAAWVLIGILVLFSGLEAFVGFCMGCYIFGDLMRFGTIPAELCQRCADLNFGPAVKLQARS